MENSTIAEHGRRGTITRYDTVHEWRGTHVQRSKENFPDGNRTSNTSAGRLVVVVMGLVAACPELPCEVGAELCMMSNQVEADLLMAAAIV
jgi:hypothetical protein